VGGSRVKRDAVSGASTASLFFSLNKGRGIPHRHSRIMSFEDYGAPGMIRTCDLWFRRPTLYPTELRVQERIEGSLRFQV
jgi:hypothetical protein